MPFNLPPLDYLGDENLGQEEMAPPPTGDEWGEPDLWTGLKARLHYAAQGNYAQAFSPEQVRVPEEEQSYASHIPGVGAVEAGFNVMRLPQGALEALYRKSQGLGTDAPFSFTDIPQAMKMDWSRPVSGGLTAASSLNPEMLALYDQAVAAWKAGDAAKAQALLEQYRLKGGFGGAAYKAGAGLISDPAMVAAPASKLVALGIAPGMVESTIRGGKHYVEQAAEHGITSPEAMSSLPEPLVSAGFLGTMAAHHFGGRGRELKPDTKANIEGAARDQETPAQAILREMQEEQGGFASASGLELRDFPEAPITLEAKKKVQVMLERVLGEAERELSSGAMIEEGQRPETVGPSGINRVVVLSGDAVPLPDGTQQRLNGPGAVDRSDGTFYVTRRGAQGILQAKDAHEALIRAIDLVSHEAPHPGMERGWVGPRVDPMTGEPLSPEQLADVNRPGGGHAAGRLYDDRLKDVQHLFVEEALKDRLRSNPTLREWAGQAEEAGWLRAHLQPRTDLPITSGTYQPDVLQAVREALELPKPLEMETASTPTEAGPAPRLVQSGGLRKAIEALTRGWGRKKKEATEAGVGDPRFAAALRQDLIRKDIRESPLGLAARDVVEPPAKPAAMQMPPIELGPVSKALLGRRQYVPDRYPALKEYISRMHRPIGHRGRFGKWLQAVDEVERIFKEEGGGNIGIMRKMGIEQKDLMPLANNLRVMANFMKRQGKEAEARALQDRVINMARKAPRATGFNKRNLAILEGTATPRQAEAQASAQEHLARKGAKPSRREERRAARYERMEKAASKEESKGQELTAAFGRFRDLVRRAEKPREGDNIDALIAEATQLAGKIKEGRNFLNEGQRKSYLETLQNLVTQENRRFLVSEKERKRATGIEEVIEPTPSKAREQEGKLIVEAGRRRRGLKPPPKPKLEDQLALDRAKKAKRFSPFRWASKQVKALHQAARKKGLAQLISQGLTQHTMKPFLTQAGEEIQAPYLGRGEKPKSAAAELTANAAFRAKQRSEAMGEGPTEPRGPALEPRERWKQEEHTRRLGLRLSKEAAARAARLSAAAKKSTERAKAEKLERRKAVAEARTRPEAIAARLAARKPPYAGEKLADLGPSEMDRAKAIDAKLKEAAKIPLQSAAYSTREGVTIAGKPVEGAIRVKLANLKVGMGEWIQGVRKAVWSEEPHARTAQRLARDLNSLSELSKQVSAAMEGKGALPVSYEKLRLFGFTKATARQVERLWQSIPKRYKGEIVPLHDRVAQYKDLLENFIDHQAWDTLGLGKFRRGEETYHAVGFKRRSGRWDYNPKDMLEHFLGDAIREEMVEPESKSIINSRLKRLVSLNAQGFTRPLIKDYVQHLAEGKQNLLRPSTEVRVPWGGRREGHEYSVRVEHRGKEQVEQLLPWKALVDRVAEAAPGVDRRLLVKVLLQGEMKGKQGEWLGALGKFPGTGREKLYSYSEALGTIGSKLQKMADAIAAKHADNPKAMEIANRWAEIGAKLDPSNFKLLEPKASRRPIDVTQRIAEFRKTGKKRSLQLEYHSAFEPGVGTPSTIHPTKAAAEPVRTHRNARTWRTFNESIQPGPEATPGIAAKGAQPVPSGMRVIVPEKGGRSARGLRVSSWKRFGKPSDAEPTPPGVISTPVVKAPELRAEPLERHSKKVARILTSMRTRLLMGGDKKALSEALSKAKESYRPSFDQLDKMVETFGVDRNGENKLAKLHTKQAIYNMQRNAVLREHGVESMKAWVRNHPYADFDPKLHYNDFFESPAFEKWDAFLKESSGEVTVPRADVAGEWFYDPAQMQRWRAELVQRAAAEELRGADTQLDEYLTELGKAEQAEMRSKAKQPKVVELPSAKAEPFQRKPSSRALLATKLLEARKLAWKEGRELSTEEASKILNPPPAWESPKKKFDRLFSEAGARKKEESKVALETLGAYSRRKGFSKVRHRQTEAQIRNHEFIAKTMEYFNFTRPLRTAADLSNPFRNTWQLTYAQILRDAARWARSGGKERGEASFRRNLVDMTKAFAKKEFSDALLKNLEMDEYYQEGKRWGLKYASESARLESFIGKEVLNASLQEMTDYLAQKPIFGKPLSMIPKALHWVIEGSERSYNYYQNKAMRDAFKHAVEFLDHAKAFDPKNEVMSSATKFEDTMKSLVNHINTAASRSKVGEGWLPKGQRRWVETILNGTFYSAQMNLARLKMLGNVAHVWRVEDINAGEHQPFFQLSGEGAKLRLMGKSVAIEPGFASGSTKAARQYARMQTLQALGGALAGVGLVYTTAHMAGLTPTVETDPRSTDFMKVRMGPVAWDGWGGVQQFLRAGAQIATGKRKEIGTGKLTSQQPLDTLTKFGRSKLAPGAQLVVDSLTRRTGTGEAYDVNKDPVGYAVTTMKNLFLPMSFEDVGKMMQEDPRYGFLIPLMLLGHGVSAGQGAKEAWLGAKPGLRQKDIQLSKELREQGVTGSRLSHRVTLPGQDVYGQRNYYNLTPGEVEEFEKQYMPMVTELLYNFINSPAYQALPASRRPAALRKAVHTLNTRYGATRTVGQQYRKKYLGGKLKPSGKAGDQQMQLAEELEAKRLERARESSGKMEAF